MGMSTIVFVALREMRAAAALKPELGSIGLNPRELYAESLNVIQSHLPLCATLSDGRRGKTEGNLSEDPLAALFFFVNGTDPEGISELTLDWHLRERLKPLPIMKLRSIELFLASAELQEARFQRVRRLMSRRQRQSADKIRLDWQGRLSARVEGVAQSKTDRAETRHQNSQWARERTDTASELDLTGFLRAQGPDMWHEVCINIEWMDRGAAELVPFVEWLIAQPELDQGSALALLAKSVCDGVDTEPYEQHDCARNRAWMKTAHDGLMNGFFAPMQRAIPPSVRQDVELLFEPESVGAWAIPRIDLDQIPTRPHHSEHAFIDNRPVEGFDAWKIRSGT